MTSIPDGTWSDAKADNVAPPYEDGVEDEGWYPDWPGPEFKDWTWLSASYPAKEAA